MSAFDRYLLDRNGDGFVDDASARILVAPSSEVDPAVFWPAVIDAAALLGLHAQALPLPLFVAEPPGVELECVAIQAQADVAELLPSGASRAGQFEVAPGDGELSGDLLDLFTTSGLLADTDGDLVPDATRFGLALPDDVPLAVGVALCNLAVRVGLESGGVTLPLVSDARPSFRIAITEGPATITVADTGWLANGDAAGLANLIEAVAAHWPYYGLPETAGARAGVDALAAFIANGGEPEAGGTPVVWELQWSARSEVERLIDSVEASLLPRLGADSELDLTAFVCEPPTVRRRLEHELRQRIEARGVRAPGVRVLSAFKVGLSWLTEVVLPELAGRDVGRLEVRYRRFEAPEGREHLDMPIRWLQELFPGDEIAATTLGIPLEDIALTEDTSAEAPIYRATATDSEGRVIGAWETDLLSYALPFMPNVEGSAEVAVTTGGFRATLDGAQVVRQVETDLDRFWIFFQREVLPRIIAQINVEGGFRADWQPFFGALEVEVWLSAPNSRLGVREENDSAAEALHEDIYFNTLDTLEELGLRTTGDKTSAPGAVIPIVHVQAGVSPHAIVRLRAAPAHPDETPQLSVETLCLEDGELRAVLTAEHIGFRLPARAALEERFSPTQDGAASYPVSLQAGGEQIAMRLPLPVTLGGDGADEPPPLDLNIHGSEVETWAGRVAGAETVSSWIEGRSYQGRPVPALALHAPAPGRVWSPTKLTALKPTVLIVARHHANEISSTNAALQLAHLIGADTAWGALIERLNIVVIPYENADGAALHAMLAGAPEAATWKHHPARYNALGHEFGEDYFKADTPFGEARVRPALWRRWLPDALVDNHGVPSHEWVQPFAGFGSPPRFHVSYWVPQALIYGIVRHVDDPEYPEHAAAALALRDAVSAALRDTPSGELNREIGASYRRWGQSRVPERFPGTFHDDMLWHFGGTPADPEGRGFNVRYPKTTVLSWVTEVNDETATGAHLEMVARAHLSANRAMLDVIVAMDATVERSTVGLPDGRTIQRFMRKRPLKAR